MRALPSGVPFVHHGHAPGQGLFERHGDGPGGKLEELRMGHRQDRTGIMQRRRSLKLQVTELNELVSLVNRYV